MTERMRRPVIRTEHLQREDGGEDNKLNLGPVEVMLPFQKPSPHHLNLVLIFIGCFLKPAVAYLPLLLARNSSSVSNMWRFRESISCIRRKPGVTAVLGKWHRR